MAESKPNKATYRRRRLIAGGASLLLVAGGVKAASEITQDATQPTGFEGPTAPYRVSEGDTSWGIATQVEANQDGVAGNQDIRPIVDDINAQAAEDGKPGLQNGEGLRLPVAADRDPSTPQVDLDK